MSEFHQVHPRRRRRAKSVGAFAALAVGVSGMIVTSQADAAPGDTVQILSFNDYHGHVEAGTAGSIDGTFGGPAAGGGEFLAAKLAELRAASTADASFTVAAGDLIGGSPFFSGLFHDEPSVESLNEMGLDISGVGNHEFDEGVDELLRMQNGGCHPVDGCYFTDYDPDTVGDQEFGGAEFQWLAANVIEDASGDPLDLDDGRGIDDLGGYSLVDVNGTSIAFIGMTLEGTDALVAASGVAGYSFADEVETANALVPDIKAAGAEAIFVLLHEGGIPNPFEISGCQGISGPIVAINDGLDAEIDGIISGHTHQPYTCSLEDPDGDERPVVSAWEFGKVVTELNFTLDGDGDVDRSTVTMVNHPVLQSELTADAAVTAVIDKWTPLAETEGNTVVGSVTETITRGGDPTGSDRGVESAAGNLVADAQLAATADLGAQVAFMNPGGVRSDLEFPASGSEADGEVTFGEAFTFQPFNNTMFVLPMTGAQIIAVLEEQCQPGDSSRPVLHLGVSDGFTYDLDITLQSGVCTGVVVSNVKLDGADLDPTATYQVAVNNFLADGGDNFGTFAEVDVLDRIPGPQDIDALTDYLAANSPVAPPSTDRVNEIGTTLPEPINPLTPARILETRVGPDFTTDDGLFEGDGPVAAGGTIELQVAGRGGVAVDASAANLNVGAVVPTGPGFLTVYPCDQDRPNASNVNYDAGITSATAVFAQLDADGKACIYSHAETDVIVDVNGEVPDGGSPVALTPARVLETRTGPGLGTDDGLFNGIGQLAAGETLEVDIAERGGVPADARSAVLSVAAVAPIGPGFLTIWSCVGDRPNASNVNFMGGEVAVPNAVVAELSPDGTVCIYTHQTTDLIADVNGFVPVGGTPDPVGPARLLETRTGPDLGTIDGESNELGRLQPDSTTELMVAGRGGVSDAPTTVMLNVTAIEAIDDGFATVYPCDEDRPNASNVNFDVGEIVANAVVAKVDPDGKVCIFVNTELDLVVDVVGEVAPPVPFRS